MSLSILDGSVKDLEAAIPTLSLGELEALLSAENAGKTRKGAVALLEAAIADIEEPLADEADVLVENIVPGTQLHFGDGRKIGFGESAYTTPEIAELMRQRGQAR